MNTDTLKSLGFLKKSLKMNAKAISKNETTAGIAVDPTIAAFIGHSAAMLAQIDAWEKAAVPVAAPAPAGVVQPAPAASTVSTVSVVPLLPDTDDDLMI